MYNAPFHFSCQGMDHAGGAAAAERQTSKTCFFPACCDNSRGIDIRPGKTRSTVASPAQAVS